MPLDVILLIAAILLFLAKGFDLYKGRFDFQLLGFAAIVAAVIVWHY